MRVPDKTELKGLPLFSYLKSNKKAIIETKKSLSIKSEPFAAQTMSSIPRQETSNKAKGEELPATDKGSLLVRVVANTSNVIDSHLDALAPDCWLKTIKENGPTGKNIIAHIHDHKHDITAKVGKVQTIAAEMIDTAELGIKTDVKQAQALTFKTLIFKDFNEKVFNLYKAGEINQHSIGMQYVKMQLCINSEAEEYAEEFAAWEKYYPLILNKDAALSRDYFWYVTEIKLFENSAVLFGSNEVTPTLQTGEENNDNPEEKKSREPQEVKALSIYSYM